MDKKKHQKKKLKIAQMTEIEENKYFIFKWQISSTRSPVSNPEKASSVKISFSTITNFETNIELQHTDFTNHGKNSWEYFKAMNSDGGWDYILNCFKVYCH